MPSKIETELTPEEIVDFLEELASTKGGTRLRVIQQKAAERGVKVSAMAATTFRDGALEPYLDRIKGFREKSAALADMMAGGEGDRFLTVSRTALAEQIMDFLLAGGVMPKQFASLSKAVASLTGADQSERLTRARLEKMELELKGLREAGAKILSDEETSAEDKAAQMRGLFGIG